jgi:GNAT superfamily N-acetyltransferase
MGPFRKWSKSGEISGRSTAPRVPYEGNRSNGSVAWIEELMVSESVRSRGVATKLMSSAEEWAKGVPTAHAAVANRRAADFYRRIGYEESANYYRKTFAPTVRWDSHARRVPTVPAFGGQSVPPKR